MAAPSDAEVLPMWRVNELADYSWTLESAVMFMNNITLSKSPCSNAWTWLVFPHYAWSSFQWKIRAKLPLRLPTTCITLYRTIVSSCILIKLPLFIGELG